MPDHTQAVTAWLEAATRGSEPLAASFESAFGALCRRAGATLGEATLGAAGHRVVSAAAKRFSFLEGVDAGAISNPAGKLHAVANGVPTEEQARAFGFILQEFLSVVGALTAEVLTPSLHEELARATSPDRAGRKQKGPRP